MTKQNKVNKPNPPLNHKQIKVHTKTPERSIICLSTTPEYEAYPGMINIPSIIPLEKTDFPFASSYK